MKNKSIIGNAKSINPRKLIPNKLTPQIKRNTIVFYYPNHSEGQNLNISFERVLRSPDDGKSYPVSPCFANFPIKTVEDHLDTVPSKMKETGGIFICLFKREALRMHFFKSIIAHAVKITVGKVNTVTGKTSNEKHDQDYIITPNQKWLTGYNDGNGNIRQFASPLDQYEHSDTDYLGNFQITCFYPHEENKNRLAQKVYLNYNSITSGHRGLVSGGRISDAIIKDMYGSNVWNYNSKANILVHLVNPKLYYEITGETATCPISSKNYSRNDYPCYSSHAKNAITYEKTNANDDEQVIPFLYLSGKNVAEIDHQFLREAFSITHILNVSETPIIRSSTSDDDLINIHSDELNNSKIDFVEQEENLMERKQNFAIKVVHLPIFDTPNGKLEQILPTAFEFLEKCFEQKGCVLVHCTGGVSRSASVVAAFIMYRFGLNLKRVLAILKERRPCVGPNFGFIYKLKIIERRYCNEKDLVDSVDVEEVWNKYWLDYQQLKDYSETVIAELFDMEGDFDDNVDQLLINNVKFNP